ncbi:MAG: hypothetical protein NVS2B7_35190 [Herpetosiphon sp.]
MSAVSEGDTIRFELQVSRAAVTSATLWYDLPSGHALRMVSLNGTAVLTGSVTIRPTQSDLVAVSSRLPEVDYWWGVTADDGTLVRRAGSALLGGALQQMAHVAADFEPPPAWQETDTAHVKLFYLPQTPAARDIGQIAPVAEEAYTRAATVLSVTAPLSVSVFLVPRVFWQGGVAYGDTVLISYADRNYTAVDTWSYFVHELVHAVATHVVNRRGEVGGLLGEGVAVFTVGGHYGSEPYQRWAAALQDQEQFISLCTLRTDWQNQQHEIAYLEAGSFVDFLVQHYGLEQFQRMYAHEPAVPEHTSAGWCQRDATRPVIGIGKGYGELEVEWRAWLREQHPTPQDKEAVQTQVRLFDLVRHYEELRDPAARLLPPPPPGWFPPVYRRLSTPASDTVNIVDEILLDGAGTALRSSNVVSATLLLESAARMIEQGQAVGEVGQTTRDIVATLDGSARAVRLGDREEYARLVAPHGPAWETEPWQDYRWSVNGVALGGTRAQVQATLLAARAGRSDLIPYTVWLEQRDGRWQVVRQEKGKPPLRLPPRPDLPVEGVRGI